MRKVTYEVAYLFGPSETVESWVVEKEDCEKASKLNGLCEGVKTPDGNLCSDCRSCWDYAFREDEMTDDYPYSEGDEE